MSGSLFQIILFLLFVLVAASEHMVNSWVLGACREKGPYYFLMLQYVPVQGSGYGTTTVRHR